jgi:hypothetical protein
MKFRFGAIAIALLLVVAATGCGSKKKAAVTTSAAPPATTTATSPTTTASSGGSTTTTATTTSSKPAGFASAKDCAQLEGLGKKFSAEFEAAATGGKTPDYAKEVSLFKSLADAAPSSVHGDLETLADAFAAEAAALQKAHITPGKTPSASQLAALAGAGKAFSAPKVLAATQHLEAYGESHCGVK